MGEIRVPFQVETQYGMYCDALHFPEDQVPPDDEIERLKQERVDNWIVFITTPPVMAPDPPVEVIDPPVEEVPQDG